MAITTSTPSNSKVLHRALDNPPLMVHRAEGHYLYTSDGSRILDASGGAAVVSIGHCRKDINEALLDQLSKVSYVASGLWATEPAEELAEMLVEDSGMSRAVFFSSGSEAMEAAIKLAKQYHIENGQPQRCNFIGREQSYHGNTLGGKWLGRNTTDGLAVGRHQARRKPYLNLFSDSFHSVSPCFAFRYLHEGESEAAYVARLASELERRILELGPDTVAAFVAETVVGATSGCTPAVPGYFAAIREICNKYGVLLVLDEIMCGMGRTGKLHAWEHHGVRPDIEACGKGLSGGYVPISTVLVSHKVVDVLNAGSKAFNNGHTFQSSSLACRAGLEVQKVLKKEGLVERCAQMGAILEESLRSRLGNHPKVGDIRGQGLFFGVEFVQEKQTGVPYPATKSVGAMINEACIRRGVVLYHGKGTIDGVSGDHILVSPPYTIETDEISLIADVLLEAIDEVLGS